MEPSKLVVFWSSLEGKPNEPPPPQYYDRGLFYNLLLFGVPGSKIDSKCPWQPLFVVPSLIWGWASERGAASCTSTSKPNLPTERRNSSPKDLKIEDSPFGTLTMDQGKPKGETRFGQVRLSWGCLKIGHPQNLWFSFCSPLNHPKKGTIQRKGHAQLEVGPTGQF